MREVRFKLYNRHDGKMYIFEPKWGNYGHGSGWVGGVPLEDFERDGRIFAPSNQAQLEPESCEWLQFTGLLDKNGKEIYEGDIIATWNEEGERYLDIIGWDEGQLCWGVKDSTDYLITLGEIADHELQVVGNIYENPELLPG